MIEWFLKENSAGHVYGPATIQGCAFEIWDVNGVSRTKRVISQKVETVKVTTPFLLKTLQNMPAVVSTSDVVEQPAYVVRTDQALVDMAATAPAPVRIINTTPIQVVLVDGATVPITWAPEQAMVVTTPSWAPLKVVPSDGFFTIKPFGDELRVNVVRQDPQISYQSIWTAAGQSQNPSGPDFFHGGLYGGGAVRDALGSNLPGDFFGQVTLMRAGTTEMGFDTMNIMDQLALAVSNARGPTGVPNLVQLMMTVSVDDQTAGNPDPFTNNFKLVLGLGSGNVAQAGWSIGFKGLTAPYDTTPGQLPGSTQMFLSEAFDPYLLINSNAKWFGCWADQPPLVVPAYLNETPYPGISLELGVIVYPCNSKPRVP